MLDKILEVPVSRGDDRARGAYGFRSSDPAKLVVVEEGEELGLDGEGHLAYLVEEQGPRPRGFNQSRPPLRARAGEEPLLVAEELCFEKSLRHGRAVEVDEGLRAVGGVRVDELGDQALSRSALPGD